MKLIKATPLAEDKWIITCGAYKISEKEFETQEICENYIEENIPDQELIGGLIFAMIQTEKQNVK